MMRTISSRSSSECVSVHCRRIVLSRCRFALGVMAALYSRSASRGLVLTSLAYSGLSRCRTAMDSGRR